MANIDDHLTYYRKFFENFAKTVNPQDQLPVKLGSYKLINLEVIGGVIDWTTQYLTQKQCPESLLAPLIQMVIDETRKLCKKHPLQCGFNPTSNAYEPLKLMQTVMAKTNEICLRYLDNSMLCSLPPPGPPFNIVSVSASKNKRRRMEDRHVVIHDLNTMFNIQEASPSSYFAIFDGHAGHDAAAYSAAHLHQFLAESKHFATNPEQALLDAFCKTDALFIEKCKVESFASGTTAVCALLRPKENTLYIAWVGDSQALLVNRGRILQCVKPHKPCREDEKHRIESQGGFVSFWGTWRVNGQLAVSRAIGDADYKPFVSAIPEIREIQLDGGEDFLILGCDGLWDFLSENDTALAVYNMVCQNPDQTDIISQQLVKLSKESGSSDNISVIVVFLREPSKIAAEAHWANRNGSPPIAMDTSLDNANNPFANSNGSDNTTTRTTTPPPLQATIDTDNLKSDGFLLNLSTEHNYKQNGGNVDDLVSSPTTNDFYQKLEKSNGKRSASEFDDDDDDIEENNDNIIDNYNERDEDDNDDAIVVDDLGPETDVDTADILSPSMITAKALADGIMNNNPEGSFNPFIEKEEVEKAALEIHHDLHKQISEDDDDDDDDVIDIDRKTPTTPSSLPPKEVECEKTDVPENVPVHDVGGSLEENVADSGDDSEDEWNYIKGDEANKENLNPVEPEQEVAASIEEDLDDNMSQLNPNAAEFVPVSPTRSIPSPACQALINDPVLSQSPKRASEIDLSVPNQKDFEIEVKSRPSDVGLCDSNGHQEIDDNNKPQSPSSQELENLLNGKNIDEIPEFQPSTTTTTTTNILTPTKVSNDEFHFGPNATPFTPGKLLDQSVTTLSTKAVYGDESTATIQSFDESTFGQDNIDFITSSTLNKESDPMSMSFYQEKTDDLSIDVLNHVQTLPDDLDDFLNKPDKKQQQQQDEQLDNTVITKTEQSNEIINLDNDERIIVETTDLDRIVDDEKDIASPVDNDLSDDICELPKSPDLITNEIVEKENEEDKEKEMFEEKEKETIEEKELEEEETSKEIEIEAICDRIAESPELLPVVSPSPEPIQNDLLLQDNLVQNDLVIEEKEPQQQLVLDDLVEQKLITPEPEIETIQEQNSTTISPLPTHEVPIVETQINQADVVVTSSQPILEDHYTLDETKIISSVDTSTDIEKKDDSIIEDVTSSVKDATSPVVVSPIPDQEIVVSVSEQEQPIPIDESSPINEKQSEVLVPDICTFSPPESVATAEVNSFLERSEISDVHSPLVASPVAVAQLTNETVVSEDHANLLDLNHPLSKCVFPLPTEFTETAPNKTEDDNKIDDNNEKVEQDLGVAVEEIVEQKTEQTENTTVEVVATAAAVAATATAITAATVVVEKKATDKPKTLHKKPTTTATTNNKTTPSKMTTTMSRTKPTTPTTKPSTTTRTSATAAKSTTSVASPKTTTTMKTNVGKLATTKPKTASSSTVPSKTGVDKKPIANGDVKSARSAIAIKKTESTTTTAAKPSSSSLSSRPVSSTLNKTSPTKSKLTQPSKVTSSTTNKISSTTTSATTKSKPSTLASKTTSTTKTSTSSATSKTTATKTTSSTRTALSSPRAPRPTTTTTTTAKPRVPLTKTITKTSADAEKQNKESANKLTASRSTTTTTARTAGKSVTTSTTKKTEVKNSTGSNKTTVTKTSTAIGRKPNEITRNVKTTTTKTTKIEKPIQNGISSVVTEQIIVNNDNEPQLVKDNSPIDNKLIVETNATD